MRRLISIVIALGLVLTLACSASAQMSIAIEGQGSNGLRADIASPLYNLELRSIDSANQFSGSFAFDQETTSAATEYNLAGWWNQVGEKIGMRDVTSSKFEELASGVDMIGKAIVGQGEASAGLNYLSHFHQAQGIGQAQAGFAYINAEEGEDGNLTITRNQGRLTFEGSWSMNYMLETMAPVGAEEEEFDWWGSICQGVTGWTMPELSGEGQWLR